MAHMAWALTGRKNKFWLTMMSTDNEREVILPPEAVWCTQSPASIKRLSG